MNKLLLTLHCLLFIHNYQYVIIMKIRMINTEQELRKEIARIYNDKELKPYQQGMLLDMILSKYNAILNEEAYYWEIYDLTRDEVKLLKSTKFQLGRYPFSTCKINTQSTFYKRGVKIVNQVLTNKVENRFVLNNWIKEAIGFFEISSHQFPEAIGTELKLYEWDLNILNGLLIDFRRSTWNRYYKIISKRIDLDKDELFVVRDNLYHSINEIETILRPHYNLQSFVDEYKNMEIIELLQPNMIKYVLDEGMNSIKFDINNIQERIEENIIDRNSSVLLSVIKKYMQKPLQKRVEEVTIEKFNEFENNLELIKQALLLLKCEVDNPSSKVPKYISNYLKINMLDPDFVGKHSLTFEDKDIFTIVVILEEILSGIFENSINPYFKDLFSSIFRDENSMTTSQIIKSWVQNNKGSNMYNLKDMIMNSSKLGIDEKSYGEGIETFLNYNWEYKIYSKSIFQMKKVFYPEFKNRLLKQLNELRDIFNTLYSKLYKSFKLNMASKIEVSRNYNTEDLIFFNEYLHFLQLKAEDKITAYKFLPSMDFELRELSINFFGIDIFSKNRYNLSNRPQLKQLALGFQYMYQEIVTDLKLDCENIYWHSDEFVNAI